MKFLTQILILLLVSLSLTKKKKHLSKYHSRKMHSNANHEKQIYQQIHRFLENRHKKQNEVSGEPKEVTVAPVAPEQQTLESLIKNPNGPACEDDSTFDTRRDSNVFVNRFSTGPAAYFYDAIEEMLVSSFTADLTADFDYFVSLSVTKSKVKTQPKGVDVTGLTQGIKEDFWLNKNKTGTPADFMKMFTKDGKRIFQLGDGTMNMRSFGYFEITYFTRKATSLMNCTHCLVDIKKKIIELFQYLDCTQQGLIDAKMIYGGLQNLDLNVKPTTTMVNDFVLKAMEFNTATLDLKDFMYGCLMGMLERQVPDEGFKLDSTGLDVLKKARLQAIAENRAPLRRRFRK